LRKTTKFLLAAGWLFLVVNAGAQSLALQTASGGITVNGPQPNFTTGFGTVNGLGLGSAPTGTTLLTSGVSGGVLYTSPITMAISGAGGGNKGVIQAYVSTNFAHTSVLTVEVCPYGSTCTSAANFSAISTSAGSPTPMLPIPGVLNGNYDAYLGLFVSNGNGAGYISGTDSATLTVIAYKYNGSTLVSTHTYTLALNSPSANVQTAVGLSLATASGGLTISPATDFSTSYGNVNGLGIGPGTGLTVIPVAGGVVYQTPYLLQPTFSTFTSTTGTLSAYVSTNFTHSSVLALQYSFSSGGPYSNISTSSSSPTVGTSAASSGSATTSYLGLFVATGNGNAFPGSGSGSSDNATLTFTLTVP